MQARYMTFEEWLHLRKMERRSPQKGLFALWNTWISTPLLTDLAQGKPVSRQQLEAIGVSPGEALRSVQEQSRWVEEKLPATLTLMRGIPEKEILQQRPNELTLPMVASATESKEIAQWFAKPVKPGEIGATVTFAVPKEAVMSHWRANPELGSFEKEVIVKPGSYEILAIEEVK